MGAEMSVNNYKNNMNILKRLNISIWSNRNDTITIDKIQNGYIIGSTYYKTKKEVLDALITELNKIF